MESTVLSFLEQDVPLPAVAEAIGISYETARSQWMHDRLAAAGIVTDVRASRIRFGFGCYHAEDDIAAAAEAIARVLSA